MEDDGHSSTGYESLFIQEEDGQQERARMDERLEFNNLVQSGIPHIETRLSSAGQIHPYLREMDELLKSCEELAGVPLDSHFSPSYTDTCLSDVQPKALSDFSSGGYGETSTSLPMSSSTTYIDTRVEVSDTEGQPTQAYHEASSNINTICETDVDPSPTDISLTSAGTALSENMTEYESQLMGMLTMLENCMEESGIDLGSGMDFDTQECFALDTNHDYIQISSQRCDAYTAVENRRAATSERAALQSWGGHDAEPGITGQYSSVTPGKPIVRHVEMESTTLQRQEHSESVMSETSVQEHQLSFSSSKTPMESQNGSPNLEETCIQTICGGKGSPTRGDDTGLDTGEIILSDGEGPEVGMDMAPQRSSTEELTTVGCQMEKYIEEVESLQRLRTVLLEEVLGLRRKSEEQGDEEGKTPEQEEKGEPEETIDSKAVALLEELKKEEEKRREERQRDVLAMREQRAEEERSVWKMNLERQGLQVETWRLKRKLFTEAKNCAYSLAALTNQQHAVERFKIEEAGSQQLYAYGFQEKLQSLVLQLTEECSRLRLAHQEKLSMLQAKLQAQNSSQTYSTVEELTECRRHSCGDIQQYLQGGLKALEERYEPMLMKLLKRRETTASALSNARQQVQELRGRLGPLMEEGHRLGVQRVGLEERFELMQMQRQEDIKQYKAIVLSLEESSWEMQAELKIQKRKTKETEEIKDNLSKKLLLYRYDTD
ncbi:Syncoilin [Merluccius polli]|uniref:Syncoilin n=1 Tax=Merluccius polli TaxID=89951 RepID=A0AA47P0X7_MERPO|nr:Syncoilin [Merluccius polli]